MRIRDRRRAIESVIGSLFFILIMIISIGTLIVIFNSFNSYSTTTNKVANTRAQVASTQLSVTSASFGAFPPLTTSKFNVTNTCSTTSTSTTNTEHLVYAAGMWWDFFYCNSNFQYSTSFDGANWEAATTIPLLVAGYTVGPYFEVDVVGNTLYLAIAYVAHTDFQFGIGTLAAGGTNSAPAGTITWVSAPAQVPIAATIFTESGPIQVAADSQGNVWVATVQGTCSSTSNCGIGIYNRQACVAGTSAADGWESNSCTTAGTATNYAPTSTPVNLGALSEDTNMILETPPSTLSAAGFILIYASGSSTTIPSTGTIGILTAGTVAPSTWYSISTSALTYYYSVTSSSSVIISSTIYFAGLASTASGTSSCSSTCSLRFWTLAFSSISAGTVSSDASGTPNTSGLYDPIESSSQSWEAALTAVGTTLVLFDNPPTGVDTCSSAAGTLCIQYYSSSTLGSIWNLNYAILLKSSESAINGLTPASGGFAVTWVNAAPNVRFAALTSISVTNSSPFGVHIVDLYIYNPATNLLVAHYYLNTTEDFDYWVGQGSTTYLPVRFIWTASTSYLVTVGTDTGVTAQLTAVTLPSTTAVTCTTQQYFTQTSPVPICNQPFILASATTAQSMSTTTFTTIAALQASVAPSTTYAIHAWIPYSCSATEAANFGVTAPSGSTVSLTFYQPATLTALTSISTSLTTATLTAVTSVAAVTTTRTISFSAVTSTLTYLNALASGTTTTTITYVGAVTAATATISEITSYQETATSTSSSYSYCPTSTSGLYVVGYLTTSTTAGTFGFLFDSGTSGTTITVGAGPWMTLSNGAA